MSCSDHYQVINGFFCKVEPSMAPPDLTAANGVVAGLTEQLASERARSSLFLRMRDDAICESERLTVELATEKASFAEQLEACNSLVGSPEQNDYLSSYICDYTTETLNRKTCCERAALLASIQATTKTIWDSGIDMHTEIKIKVIRTMLAPHGFVFRDPEEGETGWRGYAMMVPDVDALEQLERVVRTHRAGLNPVWYLMELVGVMIKIGEYLVANP